jgi:hypothetical protein
MNLDFVNYGNPTIEQIKKIQLDEFGYLDKAMDFGIIDLIFKNHKFPANSSETTKQELEYICKLTQNATDSDIKFCKLMENKHYTVLSKFSDSIGLNIPAEQIKRWVGKVDSITYYLKDKFNRPRPHQLARELNIPLYPLTATDANSASYPSGHTMDFLITLYHFYKQKPSSINLINSFYERIKNVRELSGLHYPSDGTVSELLFMQLIKHKII